ncbi:hypothetical protein Ccar_16130 [Clostridium carboxidivorans P7]|uniref:Uncharacterized protein n=1 Tax=Clostridium carboxidivorans P7 TaxID=536227 RepID=C6Q155_9CLOT|nr:hypothetical protein [Clostridium carboxidivorans]AKN32307.1 hypothetical protein Ccar_16130 [Clostridium carboxidivorans P7]EET84791.1 hypothetical protein CcarbDRAFT_4772 [Clostridium carboxidivorans P7]
MESKRIDGYVITSFDENEIKEFSKDFNIEFKYSKGFQVEFDLKFSKIYWIELDNEDKEIFHNRCEKNMSYVSSIKEAERFGLNHGEIMDANSFKDWIDRQKKKGNLPNVSI